MNGCVRRPRGTHTAANNFGRKAGTLHRGQISKCTSRHEPTPACRDDHPPLCCRRRRHAAGNAAIFRHGSLRICAPQSCDSNAQQVAKADTAHAQCDVGHQLPDVWLGREFVNLIATIAVKNANLPLVLGAQCLPAHATRRRVPPPARRHQSAGIAPRATLALSCRFSTDSGVI